MFYGWYIVLAGLLILAYNHASFDYGFSAFINPIAGTFGWSYAQISFAMSLRGLETGTLNPLLGWLVDRWPARRLMLIGVILFGIGTLSISQATSLAVFYVGFLTMGLGSALAVFMVPQATTARWFKKNIGKASGLLSMGFGIGGLLFPLLVRIIDTYGWQRTFIFLALGMWILGIPLSFIFRTGPQEYGLFPDGKPLGETRQPSSSERYDFSISVKDAVKMRAFWSIGIAFMLQLGTQLAAIIHLIPYLTSLGVERSSASLVVMFVSLVSLSARIPFGWLADVKTTKYVAANCTLLIAVGLIFYWQIDGGSFGIMILFAIFFGLGIGGMAPLRTALVREYFGARRFGTISGLLGPFNTVGLVALPPIAGWVFDKYGLYGPIWLIFSIFCIISAILLSTMPSAFNPK